MFRWITAFSVLLTLFSLPTFACTDFRLTAKDNAVLITRTMEFAADLKSNLRSSNRNRQFNEMAPDGKPGLAWKALYGYVFLDGMDIDATIDGMNEVGLSFEYLYLPGETQYLTIPEGKSAQALMYLHFGDWVLSNFKTVEEVKKALNDVYVFGQALPSMPNMIFPLHAAIYDAAGKGIVVEFVNGKMNVFDNEVGVLTNSPTFDWQITNLRNYVNLSPWSPNPINVGGMLFAATGQGSGMKGLPGDVSPPSRFVKMNVLKATVYQGEDMVRTLNIAQHIINNVDIPLGLVRAKSDTQTANEYTQWTVFKDLTNKTFYYRTYGNTALRMVSLSQVDFSEKANRLKMPITDGQFIVDATKQFTGSRASAPPTVTAENIPNTSKALVNALAYAQPRA